MSRVNEVLVGLRCRPVVILIESKDAIDEAGYFYTVFAVWCAQDGLLCALIARNGATNVLPFMNLEFDPGQRKVSRLAPDPRNKERKPDADP